MSLKWLLYDYQRHLGTLQTTSAGFDGLRQLTFEHS